MTTSYSRGRNFEYRVRDRLLADGAVHVVRTAGSRSPADLYAFYEPASKLTRGLTRVVLVQCKNNGRSVPAAARAELMALATEMRATALLAKPGPNNRGVDFEPIHTNGRTRGKKGEPVKRKHFRQGDILFVPTDQIPETAKKVRRVKGRILVALGEATGHAHAILDRHADLFELVDSSDVAEMRVRFLHVEAEVALVHEEHHTVALPPGEYEVRRQREYAPEAPRVVAD